TAPGHPFWIKTAPGIGPGDQFTTGVTNNGVQTGTLTFAVPASAPNLLYYQCGNHIDMVGELLIVNPPGLAVPAMGTAVALTLVALLAVAALWSARRWDAGSR